MKGKRSDPFNADSHLEPFTGRSCASDSVLVVSILVPWSVIQTGIGIRSLLPFPLKQRKNSSAMLFNTFSVSTGA